MKKLLISTILLGSIVLTSCGNRTIIDTHYTFNKAKITIGDEVIEVNVKLWRDYEDSQIQIISEDGIVYLTHSSNILLIK